MTKLSKLRLFAAITITAFTPAAFSVTLYDVSSITAPTNATQLIYSPTYDSLIVKNSASAIKVVNTTSLNTSTRLATWQFTDMSLSPSGRYLYASDYGGENIGYGTPANTSYVQRLDLLSNTWQSKSAYIAGGIAAMSDDQFLLKSNDQWVTFTNNSWGTGTAATPLNSPSGYWGPGYYASVYSGDFVYDNTTGRILHGNSGESSQELQAFNIVSNNFNKQEGSGVYGTAQGYGGTLALATDSSALYYGRLQVDPLDVTHNLHIFSENIYAATGNLAFGNGDYYDAHTGQLLGILGFNTTVYGLNPNGNDFWAFDAGTNSIHYFTTTSPVPIPSAVWLLGSGLLGLIGVARRKEA